MIVKNAERRWQEIGNDTAALAPTLVNPKEFTRCPDIPSDDALKSAYRRKKSNQST
jgi:hypothetical protein